MKLVSLSGALLFAVILATAQSSGPSECCLPADFKAHYDYLGNVSPVVAYRADMWYSESYGLRYDCQLWDPHSHLRFNVFLLAQEGRYYLYNASSNSCYRASCPGCFKKFCVGGSTPWVYKGAVSIGTQSAQKFQLSRNGGSLVNEVIVNNVKNQCWVVNELQEQGLYLEADSKYANGFFSNIALPGHPWPAGQFIPPAACHSTTAVEMELADLQSVVHVTLLGI